MPVRHINHKVSPYQLYSETCLNRTFLRPTFVFGIDRCSDYTG